MHDRETRFKGVPDTIREAWSVESHSVHLDRLGSYGTHIDDLYIAAAAGHRVDEAWEHIESSHGESFVRLVRGKPLAGISPEELWSVCRTGQISESKRWPHLARIAEYRGLVSLLNYFITIGMNHARSEKRRKRPVNETQITGSGDSSRESSLLDHLADQTMNQPHHGVRDGLRAMEIATERVVASVLASLSDDERRLVNLVCLAGMSQRDAAELVGWHESRVSRFIGRFRSSLLDALEALEVESADTELKQTAVEAVRRWFVQNC